MNEKPQTPGANFKKLATFKVAPSIKSTGGVKVSSPARFKKSSSSNLFNKVHKRSPSKSFGTLSKTRKIGGSTLNTASKGSIVKTTRHQFDASKDLK